MGILLRPHLARNCSVSMSKTASILSITTSLIGVRTSLCETVMDDALITPVIYRTSSSASAESLESELSLVSASPVLPTGLGDSWCISTISASSVRLYRRIVYAPSSQSRNRASGYVAVKVVAIISQRSGATAAPICRPYLLQTAYGTISPKTTSAVTEIKIAKFSPTSSSSKIGSTSIHKALNNRIEHSNRCRSSIKRFTFLAARRSFGSPRFSRISSFNGSIESKPIFNPEQIAATHKVKMIKQT